MNPASAIQAIINYVTNPANTVSIGSDPASALSYILAIIQSVQPPIGADNNDNGGGVSGIGGAGTAAESDVVQTEPVGVNISH